MFTFTNDNKKITVYPATAENKPVIYLTTYNDDGGEVYAEVQKGGCPDFTLVTVSAGFTASRSRLERNFVARACRIFAGRFVYHIRTLQNRFVQPRGEYERFAVVPRF